MNKIKRLDLILGYTCNNSCIHCFNLDIIIALRRKGLPLDKSTEEIKKIIKEAKKNGAKKVVFTGGEPTIRKDFFELLEFAKNLGLKIGLQTNGRMFSSKEFARKTLEMDKDISFVIPLHHTNPEIHDSITRVKGSWRQTITGIKNLIEFGAKNICQKTVILKQNYENLEELVKFANKMKISSIDFSSLQYGGNARINWFKIAPRYNEIEEYLKKALTLAKKLNIKITTFGIPFCFLQGFEDCAFEIKECIEPYKNGEIMKRISTRVEDVVEELNVGRRAKAKQCKECKYFYSCLGVWKEYLETFGCEELKPVK